MAIENVFEIEEVNNEQVIIKVNATNPLTVARHPYISGDYAYITVTRGKNHILTVIKNNGTTFSFHWGDNGYTLISDDLELLRKKVCGFIANQKILLDTKSDKVTRIEVMYNDNMRIWQAQIRCNDGRTQNKFYNNYNSADEVWDELQEIYHIIRDKIEYLPNTYRIPVWLYRM